MLVALIGILGALTGTVVGAFVTQFLQRRTGVEARLHDSRITSYGNFANALAEYRKVLMDRWFAERGSNADPAAVSRKVYDARTAASSAYFQVALLASDPKIVGAAEHAQSVISSIANAGSKEEFGQAVDKTEKALIGFVAVARADVAAGTGDVLTGDHLEIPGSSA